MLTFCAWYYPRALRETGAKTRETGAKKRRNGRGKKRVPPDPLALTVILCCVVLKTLFSYGPNRRHGPKRKRRHVVLSLWGACCFSLNLASFSIAPFGSCIGFIPVLFGHGAHVSRFVASNVHIEYVMYLFVVPVVFFVLNVERSAWGFFVWKKCPTADVVLWKLRYSGRLFTGGILAYEKLTWCWGRYF